MKLGPNMQKVFARYITRNGRRIYPKNGRCFVFYVKRKTQ
jgi:hypothetical protein